ncbi:DUF1583 domain-containing protein [Fuerstiella marisgermanici]|nr:DUF1583 domain-containing protein [Fuerstiella marisgermanici]
MAFQGEATKTLRSQPVNYRWPFDWLAHTFVLVASLLVAGGGVATADETQLALDDIFGSGVVEDNSNAIRERAAGLDDDEERFRVLSDWILPSGSHTRFRVSGRFQTHADNGKSGGVLVSPVYDLLAVAESLGHLDELRHRVAAVRSEDAQQQRAKAALLAMIAMYLRDDDAAFQQIDQLKKLVQGYVPRTVQEQWPETLLVFADVHHFPQSHFAPDLPEYLYEQRTRKGIPQHAEEWHAHIASLMMKNAVQRRPAAKAISQDQFKLWIPSERHRHHTRGSGLPAATWIWSTEKGEHVTGHEDDYLFFASPLRGDFDVDADISPIGRTQVLSAGELLGQTWGGASLFEGNVRHGIKARKLNQPLAKLGKWIHYRAAYRGDECRVYLNGRLMKVIPRPATADPWIAFRSWSRNDANFRDVRITGRPVVPESIDLINPDLTGWWTYYGESYGYELAAWNVTASPDGPGEIVGTKNSRLAGTWCEHLLRYIRPLGQQSTVEYEFYFSPGSANAFPAIDRTAFAITPQKVLTHAITDGTYEQSTASPVLAEYDTSLSTQPAALPLRANEWNRMKVQINKQLVRLELNGEFVGEYELAADNSRHFGFFHFADRDELRVRNVKLTGHWPIKVPPLAEQEFVDIAAANLSDTELPDVFRHDFAADGLEQRYIGAAAGRLGRVSATPAGAVQHVTSSGAWSQSHFDANFRMDGDFDFSARFDPLDVTDHDLNGCGIFVSFGDRYQIECNRRPYGTNNQRVTVAWREPVGDGEFKASYENLSTEAKAGTFRMARRDDHITLLFAENDSDQFRVVDSRTIEGIGQHGADARLQAVANKGGTTTVTWKSLRVSADELWYLPDPREEQPRLIYVMDADGGNLQQITAPLLNVNSQGSPDWSPDATRIAFDAWTGQVETSFVYVVNADGSNMKKLGLGSMPTFSASNDRLACTSLLTGTVLFDGNGGNRENLVEEGWGAQWSPNGKWIAYESRHRTEGRSQRNITIIDVETKQKRQLLKGRDADRFRHILYNMEWSPDSSQICFKGIVSGGQEVCIVNVADSAVRTLTTANMGPDFAWHPDGRTIMMWGVLSVLGGAEAGATHSMKGNRLYQFDLESGELKLYPGQPMNQDNSGPAWSPDGKRLAFCGKQFPGPVRWTEMKAERSP